MLDSWVRVKGGAVGQVYAVCDDRPGMSLLINLKGGKSDWFNPWDLEFLNGPPKEDQTKETNTDKRTKRRREIQA